MADKKAAYGRYVIPVLLCAAIVLSILIIRPFIVPLLVSGVVAYLFYPVFRWVLRIVKSRTAAAVLVSLLILLLITIPIVLVVNTLAREAYTFYINARTFLSAGTLEQCSLQLCTTAKAWLSDSEVQRYVERGLQAAVSYLLENATEFARSVPRRIVEVFITFFAVFYLLRDGEKITEAMKRLIVTTYGKKQHIISRFSEVMYAVVFGALLVAFIQGVLGAVGFALFGISSPITWGLVMFFLALIPAVGTGLVWVPASLILIATGIASGEMAFVWKGIGLLVYSFIFVGTVDNILKPKIIGGRARVHPVLVLVGTLGGLAFMGIAGIVVGPVILAMALTFVELYVQPKTSQE